MATDTTTAHRDVREWNEKHPAGTPVRFWSLDRDQPPRLGRVRGSAWLLPSGEPVVRVTSSAGGGVIALTHVERDHTREPLLPSINPESMRDGVRQERSDV